MRSLYCLLGVLIMLVVLPSSPSPGEVAGGSSMLGAATRSVVFQRVHLTNRAFEPPTVYGNKVAWSVRTGTCRNGRGCSVAIYRGDLDQFQPRLVARLGANISFVDLYLSRRWLVWVDSVYPALGWWIWAYDRASGRRFLVDSSPSEGGPAAVGYPSVALDGDTLAVIRHDCTNRCSQDGSSSLRLIDLAHRARRSITSTKDTCAPLTAPSLTVGTLVWARQTLTRTSCQASNRVQLFVMQRKTGQITTHILPVPLHGYALGFPSDGRFVAWTRIRHPAAQLNQGRGLMLMDLQLRTLRTIAGQVEMAPRLSGRVLAWEGMDGGTIEAFDLRTSQHYLLLREQKNGPGIGFLGRSAGGAVVWVEERPNGDKPSAADDIVVARVP